MLPNSPVASWPSQRRGDGGALPSLRELLDAGDLAPPCDKRAGLSSRLHAPPPPPPPPFSAHSLHGLPQQPPPLPAPPHPSHADQRPLFLSPVAAGTGAGELPLQFGGVPNVQWRTSPPQPRPHVPVVHLQRASPQRTDQQQQPQPHDHPFQQLPRAQQAEVEEPHIALANAARLAYANNQASEEAPGRSRRGRPRKVPRNGTGERPYVCTVPGCGAAFTQSGGLIRHGRTHTGEKPFRCTHPGCNAAFGESGNLTRHIRVHTGERPFACRFGCGAAFASSCHQRRHEEIHTRKRFVCQTCGKGFVHPGDLSKHRDTHANPR